jgi:hypothetical protein
MKDPSLLTKSTLVELKQMVDEFPYFHAVRMLYLKNLALLDDVRLGKELKRMAVYVPDRMQLFMLIEDGKFNNRRRQRRLPSDRKDHPEDAVKIIDKILSTEVPSTPPPAVASDYVNWLEVNAADLSATDETASRLKHQELIDTFIENENKQRGRRMMPADENVNEKKESEDEKTAPPDGMEKTSLDDSYFTETLARVYINQKRYDKALEIIRALSLKYPKKNVYFADQIRYLEKIIHIKK